MKVESPTEKPRGGQRAWGPPWSFCVRSTVTDGNHPCILLSVRLKGNETCFGPCVISLELRTRRGDRGSDRRVVRTQAGEGGRGRCEVAGSLGGGNGEARGEATPWEGRGEGRSPSTQRGPRGGERGLRSGQPVSARAVSHVVGRGRRGPSADPGESSALGRGKGALPGRARAFPGSRGRERIAGSTQRWRPGSLTLQRSRKVLQPAAQVRREQSDPNYAEKDKGTRAQNKTGKNTSPF